MTPCDVIRMQVALGFGLLDMQRRMLGAIWQMALWSMPGAAALPEAGSGGTPAGRRKRRG